MAAVKSVKSICARDKCILIAHKKINGKLLALFVFIIISSLAYLALALPIIEFKAPTPPDNFYTNLNWTYINITSSESLNRSFIEWGNVSGFTNISMSNSSMTNWHINMTGLADGTYNYTVWAENATGGFNQSMRQFITLDTVLPAIAILSPHNMTYTNKAIALNVSAADGSPLDVWRYSLNGAQNTAFSPNITITAAPGANNITVYVNDSAGNQNESTAYFALNTTMDVNLFEPITTSTTLFVQNTTFLVNATIICRQGSCANVSGTVLYNKTSANPGAPVSATAGAEPFFINETSASPTKSCADILSEGSFCSLTWIINATDSTLSSWKLGVNFSSDSTWTTPNETSFATVSIVGCFVDITVNWASIEFGGWLAPNSYWNPASGNAGQLYNITTNAGSCNTDLYIKGTNMENSSLGYSLAVGNLSWSNTSSDYATSKNMANSYALFKYNVPPITNITTWYWINIPPIFAANYNGTVFIQGVKNGDPAP